MKRRGVAPVVTSVVSCIAASALLASCGHAPAAPAASAGRTSTPAAAPRLTLKAQDAVTVPVGAVLDLAVSSRAVVVAAAEPGSSREDHVFGVDLASGRTTTLATSAYPRGTISWVARAGDWVAWVDQSHEQSDNGEQGGMDVRWRLVARNVETHRTVLLDHSDDLTPDVPRVSGGSGMLAWSVPDDEGTAGGLRQLLWQPGDDEPRTVLRHARSLSSPVSVSAGLLVYLGPPAGRVQDPVAGDCWAVPVDGSRAAYPLTHRGLALDCEAGGGSLVWSEHISPTYRPLPPDGVLSDPWEIRTRSLGADPTQRLLSRGYTSGPFPAVGAGFAVWDRTAGRNPVVARRTTTSSNVLALPTPRAERLYAVSGRTVVTAEQGLSRDAPLTLRRYVIG